MPKEIFCDWNLVVQKNPQGYFEVRDPAGNILKQGPIDIVLITPHGWVCVVLKWIAYSRIVNGRVEWFSAHEYSELQFPNFSVDFAIKETDSGPAIKFGNGLIYINPVKGIDPALVVGLDLAMIEER